MVPLLVFVALIVMLIVLMAYSWIDHKNRIYANIIAAFLAVIIAIYLGSLCGTNLVYESSCCCYNETSYWQYDGEEYWNESQQGFDTTTWFNTTTYNCHTEKTFDSYSLAYIFGLIGIIMFIYCLIMIYEVYTEYVQEKRNRQEQEFEERL